MMRNTREFPSASQRRSLVRIVHDGGLRVGEIVALTVADVSTQNGEVRREIKLAAHQTK